MEIQSRDPMDTFKRLCKIPAVQAYHILHIGFTALPIFMGFDKFFNLLTDWTLYLSPQFNVFGDAHTTMLVVGIIEIIVGIGVWLRPRIFSYVVALWLLAIIINLLNHHRFYDVAFRDFGLLLAALALGSLSRTCDIDVAKKEKDPLDRDG